MSSLSVAGVSYLILHSDTAFLLIKGAGALYLIYLGIKLWRTEFSLSGESGVARAANVPAVSRRYFQGVLIAMTNPKVIVFTTALFPQFIDPQAALAPQFVVLVITFMTLSAVCLGAYALLVARLTSLSNRWKNSRLFNRVFGSAIRRCRICIGVRLQQMIAVAEKPVDVSRRSATIAFTLGAVFFAYAFIQRVAPSVMTNELMRDFFGRRGGAWFAVGILFLRLRVNSVAGSVC